MKNNFVFIIYILNKNVLHLYLRKKKYVYLSEYNSESLGTCFIRPKTMRTAIYIMYVYKTRFAGMSSHCSILNNTITVLRTIGILFHHHYIPRVNRVVTRYHNIYEIDKKIRINFTV